MVNKKTAIDLFSGCGGLSLGLKQAGFEMVAAVEMDALAASTYKMNFPECQIWEQDIKTVSPDAMKKALGLKKGQLDLLAGCPPCQGFSSLRTHHKYSSVKKEPMNELIFEVLKFVEVFSPKAIMIENVPGLAKDSRIGRFGKKLSEMGYCYDFEVHNAKDFGVPQNRRRMIFIALKGKEPKFAPKSKKMKSVKDVIGGLARPGKGNDPLHDYQINRAERVKKLISLIPPNGGSRSALPAEYHLECHKKNVGFGDVYGRMSWDKPSPTITCGCIEPSKGRFLHPTQNRAITVREAALLQGFPKGFKFDKSKGFHEAAKMIGNAFPPAFAKKHAKEIAKMI